MKIAKINSTPTFKSNQQQTPKNPELIDKLLDKVKNPNDVNDTVSVPRGIFKAYLCLMAGTGISSIANSLPKQLNIIKSPLSMFGSVLGVLSAIHFVKPFLMKGLTPDNQKENTDNKEQQA